MWHHHIGRSELTERVVGKHGSQLSDGIRGQSTPVGEHVAIVPENDVSGINILEPQSAIINSTCWGAVVLARYGYTHQ